MRFVAVALAGLIALPGCGGGGAEESESPDDTPFTLGGGGGGGGGDCSDPSSNPWAGTCVETFLAGCFDPAGACEGSYSAMGDVELEWESGARVLTTIDLTDPFDPKALTEIYASDGSLCATGESENMTAGCASQTTYQRMSDGAIQVYCMQLNGDIAVTCPDGSSVSATAEQSQASSGCEYGGDGEACTMSMSQ